MTRQTTKKKNWEAPSILKRAKTGKPLETVAGGQSTKTKARKKHAGHVELVSVGVAPQGKERVKKEKVVRDTFTMPRSDYEKIAMLKQRCLDEGVLVNKSELLRAGLLLLETASQEHLRAAVSAVEKVKTGRPPKSR